MKVFGQVQFIAAFFVLSVFVSFGSYAILEEKAEQTQKEQYQAEVNGKQNSSRSRVRFGIKTGAKTKPDDVHVLAHGNRSSSESISTTVRKVTTRTSRNRNTKNNRSALTSTESPQSSSLRTPSLKQHVNKTLVSHSYDSHRQQRPTTPALVAQHDIPIVYKTQATYHPNSSSSDSNVNSRKRGQHKSRQNLRQQSASRTDQVPRVSHTQSLENRASNSLNKDVNMSSNEVNRTIQANAVTNELVSTPTRGRQSRNTTALSVSTARPFFSNGFQLSNPFDFIPQIFGNLSRAVSPTASNRKPPKKYKSSTSTTSTTPVILAQIEKQSYRKAQLETSPIKTTKQPMELVKQSNDGPFRIALPTVNFFNPPTTSELNSNFEKEKGKRATVQTLRERYNCPRESEVRFQLFPKICQTDKDCSIWNRDELCCEIFGASSCVSGISKPLEETSHMPILGVIPRKCPTRPLAELWWDVQECETDNDCWPRVCCPDGRRRYCRTSQPELETVPVPVKRSFNYLTEYLECTSPPPPIFDLHPKACTSTFDCFPNVCCQEAGLRHCRPPKKSVLTLMANFLNVDFVKRLTQNIVIK